MGNPEKVNYVYSDEIKKVLSSKAKLDTSVSVISQLSKKIPRLSRTQSIFSQPGACRILSKIKYKNFSHRSKPFFTLPEVFSPLQGSLWKAA